MSSCFKLEEAKLEICVAQSFFAQAVDSPTHQRPAKARVALDRIASAQRDLETAAHEIEEWLCTPDQEAA